MSDPIDPALTAEEWADLNRPYAVHAIGDAIRRAVSGWTYGINDSDTLRRLIALENAALPDSDPRKITWEKVDAIERAVLYLSESVLGDPGYDSLTAASKALASYLPPRKP